MSAGVLERRAILEMPIVLDQEGQVQSWGWLLANLGPLSVERAAASSLGQPIFRLEQVRVVEGPAVQVIRVTDTRGLPLEGVRAVRSWAGAPELPSWPASFSRWREQGVYGLTGRSGAVGFGLGTGEAYQLPNAGVASAWVADPTGPSDRIDGLGVLGSEKRLHLDLSFRVVQELESILPEGGPDLSLAQDAVWAVEPPAPPSPPPVPLPLKGDQWAFLIERLDQVIQALEEQAAD